MALDLTKGIYYNKVRSDGEWFNHPILDQHEPGVSTIANTKKAAPKVAVALQTKLDAVETTSGKIRLLAAEGFPRGDIARVLNIRYQWVRNVLITPLKNQG